jgi:hypothetical protein
MRFFDPCGRRARDAEAHTRRASRTIARRSSWMSMLLLTVGWVVLRTFEKTNEDFFENSQFLYPTD